MVAALGREGHWIPDSLWVIRIILCFSGEHRDGRAEAGCAHGTSARRRRVLGRKLRRFQEDGESTWQGRAVHRRPYIRRRAKVGPIPLLPLPVPTSFDLTKQIARILGRRRLEAGEPSSSFPNSTTSSVFGPKGLYFSGLIRNVAVMLFLVFSANVLVFDSDIRFFVICAC